MKVSGLAKLGLVVGAVSILAGCVTSGASLTKDENGNEVVVVSDAISNQVKPKQPVFNMLSGEDYKSLLINNPVAKVKESNIKPSPVAINNGVVFIKVNGLDTLLKDQPDLNFSAIKLASEKMLHTKGVKTSDELVGADYSCVMSILAHGKQSVVKAQLSSTDTSNLSGMIGSTGAYNGLTSSGLVGVGVALGALQALSGGARDHNVTVMKMTVTNNKTGEEWENVFEYDAYGSPLINQNMVANVIREQLEPLEPEYIAVLNK